ncbi:MAG TPA: hypothetical protein VL358_05355 [Caulobacteraceae bacterium]|nr:hypothetical protein [Caulobacteraceae bacterium]
MPKSRRRPPKPEAWRDKLRRPNPTLGLEIENFAGTGPFGGLRGAETTASVEQTIETGGKRRARIATGEAELVAAGAPGRKVKSPISPSIWLRPTLRLRPPTGA